jgi:hypothetical protein
MNEPKDDLNPDQKVEECAKITIYQQSTEQNGKLGQQVLQTRILKPDEINRDINQKVQRKTPLFNHNKKITGRPSIGDISSGGQALEYAGWKVAETPTTAHYVVKK